MDDYKLHLTNNLDQLSQLPAFIERFGDECGADVATVTSLNLALEEALVNVINYAYPKGQTGDITLSARLTADKTMTFTLEDSGTAFDPTQVPDADTSLDVEDRPIGGLGIFLVRQIMDSLEYARVDGKNILTMRKTV